MSIVLAIGLTLPPTYTLANDSVETITATASTSINNEGFLTATTGATKKLKISKRPTVVGKPRLVAQQGESQEVIDAILESFPTKPVMVEVARCESRLNPRADRKGIDVGLFQINQVHLGELKRLSLDRLILKDNLTFAKILYNQGGLSAWNMSRHCWGQYL